MTTPEVPQPQIVAPTLEETRAINDAQIVQEVRALASEIQKSSELGFDPATAVKGIVTAFDFQGSPPTITVNIGGDASVEVADVRIINTYSPEIGHTVLLIKQGSQIFALGHLADLAATTTSSGSGGWVQATLSNGSHGGNENGDIYYRRILDHGSWKIQWRGGWTVSGTAMIATAQALAEEFRPTSRRSLLAARQAVGSVATRLDFNTDGTVTLVGDTTAPASATTSGDVLPGGGGYGTDVRLSGYLSQAGSDLGHSHIVNNNHDHGFSGGSHTHAVAAPTWVSLNGLEYFI